MSTDRCSFCARTRDDAAVTELVVGPYVTICDVCIEAANRMVDEVAGKPMQLFEDCTFCGHPEARGQFTAEGTDIRVCDTCICLCVEILAEQRAARTLPHARVVKR